MFTQMSANLFTRGGGRVPLVPGPFLVPSPMSVLGVGYLWSHVHSGGGQGIGVGIPYPLPKTTKAGGTHPTRMLSCVNILYYLMPTCTTMRGAGIYLG